MGQTFRKSLCLAAFLGLAAELQAAQVVQGPGLTTEATEAGYAVTWQTSGTAFKGSWPRSGGKLISAVGQDQLGRYQEVGLDTANDGTAYALRVYQDRPVVLFRESVRDGAAQLKPFPQFQTWPRGLHGTSYVHDAFSPLKFDLKGDAPWALFDDTRVGVVIAPASHVMVANNAIGPDGALRVGLEPQVRLPHAPASFSALLAFGSSVTGAYDAWGRAWRALNGRPAVADDASSILRTLGYWTDNRSSYWYNYDKTLGYEGTLIAAQQQYRKQGIEFGHLQLDSWWYLKGGDQAAKPPLQPSWGEANFKHGIYLYDTAPSDLFPNGLAALRKRLGLPLVTHSRWIDPTSPYAAKYRMSQMVSIDPAYWEHIMSYLEASGVETYEQDWLNDKAMPRLDRLEDGEVFLDEMAKAAARHHINLQYCMAFARYFLQGARYPNLHTIRTSGDGFDRARWAEFLFTAPLATASGVWPWTDVTFSADRGSLLLSVLSGGPVGVGDHLAGKTDGSTDAKPTWCGKELTCRLLDRFNLTHVARPDGVLVKPDTPLLPDDDSYRSWATAGASSPRVMTASATTRAQGLVRAAYVFSFVDGAAGPTSVQLRPSRLGIPGSAFVYDVWEQHGTVVGAEKATAVRVSRDGSYTLVVPLAPRLGAFLGDLNKWVSLGRQRVRLTGASADQQDYEVTLARGETTVHLTGFANGSQPQLTSQRCVATTGAGEDTDLYVVALRRTGGAAGEGTCDLRLRAR